MNELNLTYEKKTVYEKCDADIIAKAFEYAEGYKTYLDNSKTERESVEESIRMAEANGFKPYSFGTPLKTGDRYYYNNRGKNLFLFSIGSENVSNGIRISVAHVDAPRLDL